MIQRLDTMGPVQSCGARSSVTGIMALERLSHAFTLTAFVATLLAYEQYESGRKRVVTQSLGCSLASNHDRSPAQLPSLLPSGDRLGSQPIVRAQLESHDGEPDEPDVPEAGGNLGPAQAAKRRRCSGVAAWHAAMHWLADVSVWHAEESSVAHWALQKHVGMWTSFAPSLSHEGVPATGANHACSGGDDGSFVVRRMRAVLGSNSMSVVVPSPGVEPSSTSPRTVIFFALGSLR